MSLNMQQEFQKLTQELETARNFLIRTETELEQKEREVKTAREKLKQLTTLEDLTQIETLLNDIETEIVKLVDEAKGLLDNVNGAN